MDHTSSPAEPGDWAVLVDPEWRPRFPDEQPPAEAMVGGWPLDEEGNLGLFQPNPDFVPAGDASPTDPVDAVLRLVARGEADVDALIPTIRNAVLEVAVSDDGQLMIGAAPDGVPCVAVATAAVHRKRVGTEHWGQVTADDLVQVLPEGTDILLNPDGQASLRLVASALRAHVEQDPGGR
ncbi:hypothetical protein F4560_003185 [Saccharothrix ecbatanensis]|uniref:Type VII secretion system-associated protein n=1 Tax=Saccharothrix ecbatanensis TaxID=1105145 RepID=A0A7W9HJG8_9PSEU|nr:type VII secretion system-associated protein [Saccharothrix ecbatanensis]MBB5803417.1 hypothetical protein [Saccharothrix ecbatanensis]